MRASIASIPATGTPCAAKRPRGRASTPMTPSWRVIRMQMSWMAELDRRDLSVSVGSVCSESTLLAWAVLCVRSARGVVLAVWGACEAARAAFCSLGTLS